MSSRWIKGLHTRSPCTRNFRTLPLSQTSFFSLIADNLSLRSNIQTIMTSFNTSVIYTLTNSFTGATKFLAVDASGSSLVMVNGDSNSIPPISARWFLTTDNTPPYYHLHTLSLGQGKALDVLNDHGTSSTNLQMAATGYYSGQLWRFDQWQTGGGGYRLSNSFTGLGMHLDVYSDTLLPHLASGDYSGQHWTLTPAPVTLGVKAPSEVSTSPLLPSTGPVTQSMALPASNGGKVWAAFILGITDVRVAALVLVFVVVVYVAFVKGKKNKRQVLDVSFREDVEGKLGL